MAMQRRLLQFQSILAQQVLRIAVPKTRLPSNPHVRVFHCTSPPASSFQSPSPRILWGSSHNTGSLLPMSAAAIAASARVAAARWMTTRGARSLELFSLQSRRSSGWGSLPSRFLRDAPWAHWIPSADGMVLMIISANVFVFMLWHLADPSFMMKHFTISLDNLKSGRLHTLLTYSFSHIQLGHLINNMIGLYFFSSIIASTFGSSFLLKLYIAGALAGSTFCLLEKAFRDSRKQVDEECDISRKSVLGASAAFNAIVLLDIFLNPKRLVYMYFILPVPAALVGAAFIGVDLWRMNKGQLTGAEHLGGVLVAVLAWARIRKGWI